ncbi:MAG: Gfo/Idh/MocA family oxidoreductase [Planctomycetota bacterium]|nr:Gfo/Idh/MocA family oxidoreductase [Planctomycetota bacterium]
MIRLGMIGCGTMAGSFLSGLRELEPRVKVTALCDIDPKKLASAASSAAPGARTDTDYRRLLGACDAVVIALPHDLHHAVAKECLAAGLHVLLEKPLANTEAQCLDLIRAADASGRVLAIGYVMRHDPLWVRMGQYIRERTFGDVFQVSIWTEQFTDLSRGAWLGDARRLGGGQLFSHGCHYIDLLLLWLGRPIDGTHTGTNRGTPWMAMEGTSNVAMRFEGDLLGYHFGTWGARGSKLKYAVHTHCTEGLLELDHAAGTITLHRDASGGDLPALKAALANGATVQGPHATIVYQTPPTGKPTNAEVIDLVDAIEQGRPPGTTAREALQSLRVIWRLYDAEQRRVVADLRGLGLDEFTDRPIVGSAGQVF